MEKSSNTNYEYIHTQFSIKFNTYWLQIIILLHIFCPKFFFCINIGNIGNNIIFLRNANVF